MTVDLQDWVGRSERRNDRVTVGLVDRYRAVVGADGLTDRMPYGLHWCTCLPDAPMAELGADGHPATGGFLPPSQLLRRMWASSKVEFLSPIKSGAALERISTIAEVTEKKGRSGALLFVNVDHLTRANNVDAVREMQTIVYRDVPATGAALPSPQPHDLDEWSHVEGVIPSPAQLFRYSALTFNTHRIHYDWPYATQVEGYPALVVHGPLMAALLLRFATQIAIGQDISMFRFRGQAPAFCGQAISLVAKTDKSAVFLAVIGPDGTIVMSAQANLG